MGHFKSMTAGNKPVISIFLLLSLSSPLFAGIEFSDFLFPLEKACYFGWKGFQDEMPNLFKKAKTVVLPNGDTLFYDKQGEVRLRLSVVATLNEDKSFRTTALIFTFLPNNTEIKLEALTQGQNLTLPDIDSLRMGQLPFFPQGENEFYTQVDFFASHMNQFSIVIQQKYLKDTSNTIKADFFSNNHSDHFLEYHEMNSKNDREFTYQLNAPLDAPLYAGQLSSERLTVKKHIQPGMILGTEEYFINDLPVSAKEYLKVFGDTTPNRFSLQSFIFGMWQAEFQSMIQHINF